MSINNDINVVIIYIYNNWSITTRYSQIYSLSGIKTLFHTNVTGHVALLVDYIGEKLSLYLKYIKGEKCNHVISHYPTLTILCK